MTISTANMAISATNRNHHSPVNSSNNPQTTPFRSINELLKLTKEVVDGYGQLSFSDYLSKAFDALQLFDFQVKKQAKFGHCNYEEAFIYYKVASVILVDKIKNLPTFGSLSTASKSAYNQVTEQVFKYDSAFQDVRSFLISNSSSDLSSSLDLSPPPTYPQTTDPLMMRLNKLKPSRDHYTHVPGNSTKSSTTSPMNRSVSPTRVPRSASASPIPFISKVSQFSPFDKFKMKEHIEPGDLQEIMSSNSDEILVIDFRMRKDYDSAHIKGENTINIEPSMVKDEFRTDKDLERYLVDMLPRPEYQKFIARFNYKLIVIYDKNSPEFFTDDKLRKFIELLAFHSHGVLLNYPLFLKGGLLSWLNMFGGNYISKNEFKLSFPSPTMAMDPTPKRNSISSSPMNTGTSSSLPKDLNSPTSSSMAYNKNFSDYLSTNTTKTYIQLPTNGNQLQNGGNQVRVIQQDEVHKSYKSPSLDSINRYPFPSASTSRPSSALNNLHIQHQQQPSGKQVTDLKVTPKKVDLDQLLKEFSTGLQNLGNSCYMNCVLQCLGGTPPLVKLFLDGTYKQHINLNNKLGTKGIISKQFHDLLRLLISNNGKYVVPQTFKKVVGSLNADYKGYEQQDCIEFLNFLLDSLHEDLNETQFNLSFDKFQLTEEEERKRELLPIRIASTIEWERYLKFNFSIIVDYFQGQYLSQLKCSVCETTSTTYNSFSILSLPIPEKSADTCTLSDCLEEFCAIEVLDGDDMWNCPTCKRKTKSTKELKITRLPNILIIHFKRFKSDRYLTKLNTFVKYPVEENLDLTKYWPTLTNKEDLDNLNKLPLRNQVPPFNYKLYGVINHFGSLQTGHYTSYVHKGDPKNWCYYDDSKTYRNCDKKNVLNSNAYCLFYRRV